VAAKKSRIPKLTERLGRCAQKGEIQSFINHEKADKNIFLTAFS